MPYNIIESMNNTMGPFSYVMIAGVILIIALIIIIFLGRQPDHSWF